MNKLKLILVAVSLVSLTACFDDKTSEEVKTKKWYEENQAALAEKVKECSNNPGELMKTPNCINAKAAYDSSMLGKW